MSNGNAERTDSGKPDDVINEHLHKGIDWLREADERAAQARPLHDRALTVQDSIDQNKHLNYDESSDSLSLSDKPPEEGETYRNYSSVILYLDAYRDPIDARRNLAGLFHVAGEEDGAATMRAEASKLSKELPTDLIDRQVTSIKKALENPNLENREEFENVLKYLNDPDVGLSSLADSTQKDELWHHLGPQISVNYGPNGDIQGVRDLRFGTNQRFDPDKAFEIASEIRERAISKTGKDPLASGDVEASKPFPGDVDGLSFDEQNIYAMTEQLSGRRFPDSGKLSTTEFADMSLSIFDSLDRNGDKVLDVGELKDSVSKPDLTREEKQTLGTLIDAMPTLMGMTRAGGSDGIAKEDLQKFRAESADTTEVMDKIRDARRRLLSAGDFGKADANGNGHMTLRELNGFVQKQMPLFTDNDIQSFRSLTEEYSKISKSWWGMKKADLVDFRPDSVKRVETSLWKNFYESRAGAGK